MPTIYLTFDQVVAINQRHCGDGAGVKDPEGIRAQLGRAEATFLGDELHKTVWEKAAVLLHGLSSTQYFTDGNKRTAWLTVALFLAVNGHPLRDLSDIEAEAFVLAIATKAFENSDEPDRGVRKASEWLEECRRRPGHRRVEAFVAHEVRWNRNELGLTTGTIDVDGAFVAAYTLAPGQDGVELSAIIQLHGFPDDAGGSVRIRWDVHPDDAAVAQFVYPTEEGMNLLNSGLREQFDERVHMQDFKDAFPSVVAAHDMPWMANGVLPVIYHERIVLLIESSGIARLRLFVEEDLVREFPLRFETVR